MIKSIDFLLGLPSSLSYLGVGPEEVEVECHTYYQMHDDEYWGDGCENRS